MKVVNGMVCPGRCVCHCRWATCEARRGACIFRYTCVRVHSLERSVTQVTHATPRDTPAGLAWLAGRRRTATSSSDSTEDDEGSWLLLRRLKGKAKASKAGAAADGGGAGGRAGAAANTGKGKAPPDPTMMSPTTRASHIAQLRAELAAAEAAAADADE